MVLTASERDWLRVRSYLTEHRHDLAVRAAADYPADRRVAGTPLLAAPSWQLPAPVPLAAIGLELAASGPEPGAPAAGPRTAPAAGPLPERPDGTRYARYSDALAELAAPAVFENRSTYRLTGADLTGSAPRLAFTMGRYFDGIDTGEAAAHEYAAARLGAPVTGLRDRIGDPCDLRRRPANLAISTLTIRLDGDRASFLLHWRDPARVGHAGGLYQVIPVGVFQPSGEAPWHRRADFSLWRCMVREFAEELAGHPEDYGTGPIDYGSWPFARRMSQGLIGAWCLGLGVDPLTYATDLLTVAVFEGGVSDELFGVAPRRNAEGSVLRARAFTADVIEHAVAAEPVQAAGAALLRLAWRHRETLSLRNAPPDLVPESKLRMNAPGSGGQVNITSLTSCSLGESVVGAGNLNVGHHVVQFYGRDEDLTGSVADYLLGGLRNGGVAIVIATADHRSAIETRLAEAGIDLPAAAASGSYQAADARETVSRFMAADRPDRADFDSVIGGLIARACSSGRPVRAYGEMVALLWDDGLVNAAVRLEELWNDLGRRHSFSLYCGYQAQAVTRNGDLGAFAEVCRLHREVVGASPGAAALQGVPGALRTFAFSIDAPAAARHFAIGAVRRWGAGDLADDVALVVTELAANAILHAGTGFTLALSVQRDTLRISVRDGSPLPEEDQGPALEPAPLHGLGAVNALAVRWGVQPLGPAGKEVWVELGR
jgi:hypothetical protein